MKEQAEKQAVIDFREIVLIDLAGHKSKVDISKLLGNYIYQTTGDLGMFDIAQKMYKEGKVEMTEEIKAGLTAILKNQQCPFVAIVKTRLIEMINMGS